MERRVDRVSQLLGVVHQRDVERRVLDLAGLRGVGAVPVHVGLVLSVADRVEAVAVRWRGAVVHTVERPAFSGELLDTDVTAADLRSSRGEERDRRAGHIADDRNGEGLRSGCGREDGTELNGLRVHAADGVLLVVVPVGRATGQARGSGELVRNLGVVHDVIDLVQVRSCHRTAAARDQSDCEGGRDGDTEPVGDPADRSEDASHETNSFWLFSHLGLLDSSF